jgi:hypothetical protein
MMRAPLPAEETAVGEETMEFATRFSSAVALVGRLATDPGYAELARRHGAGLVPAVRDALDAVEDVFATGTDAVRSWPEQRKRVLEKLGELRAALDRGGVDAAARKLARALVEAVEAPRPAPRPPEPR